jgi:hypothetical protein
MVESVAKVLVKEERRPEAIPAAVPPPIFLQRHPTAVSVFSISVYIHREIKSQDIYRHF